MSSLRQREVKSNAATKLKVDLDEVPESAK
jgi:hypothetical protein